MKNNKTKLHQFKPKINKIKNNKTKLQQFKPKRNKMKNNNFIIFVNLLQLIKVAVNICKKNNKFKKKKHKCYWINNK